MKISLRSEGEIRPSRANENRENSSLADLSCSSDRGRGWQMEAQGRGREWRGGGDHADKSPRTLAAEGDGESYFL